MNRILFCALLLPALLLAACAPASESSASSPEPVTPEQPQMLLKLYCFQAGKADAFLLWNDAGAVLIDTGESGFGKTILAELQARGIARLDYLIVTHFDKDHVGGAKKLLNSIPIGTILQSNCPKPGAEAYEKYVQALAENQIEPVTVRESMDFALGDAVFSVDPPVRESYPEDSSNNSSLIVTVTHGEKRLVFLADAQTPRLNEYLAQDPPPCDFLKIPYHGRWLPNLPELFSALRPAVAVVSSSDDEPEDERTVALLEKQGTQIFLTRTAPILLISDGESISVSKSE